MTLTLRQKKHLRGLAHHLDPVVYVGDKGLSESVMAELDRALDDHELVKVKLWADRDTRKQLVTEISTKSGAILVHSIGGVASFYRHNRDKPVVALPA